MSLNNIVTELLKIPVKVLTDKENDTSNEVEDIKNNEETTSSGIDDKKDTTYQNLSLQDFREVIANAATDENGLVEFIEKNGADAVFKILDEDNNGTIEAGEISKALGGKPSTSNFSTSELVDAAVSKIGEKPTKEDPEEVSVAQKSIVAPEAAESSPESDNASASGTSSSSGPRSSSSGNTNINGNSSPKGETVEELEAEKQQTNQEYDGKIKDKNTEIKTAIEQDQSINEELKQEYQAVEQKVSGLTIQVQQTEVEISGLDTSLHNKDCEITQAEAELSKLDTNTNDAETNSKNSARKSEIEGKLATLRTEKSEIESKLEEAKEKLTQQLADKATAEGELQAVMQKIMEAASGETKELIARATGEIESLKVEKAQKIQEIDGKISVAKTSNLNNAKMTGEMAGSVSGEMATLMIELGQSQEMKDYFARFQGNYCGSYINKLLDHAFQQLGFKRQPEGLRYTGRVDVTKMSDAEKEDFIKTKLRPGMIFEYKYNSGRSRDGGYHVGMIMKVNDDGSWETLEGNTTVDGVKHSIGSHHRDINYKWLSAIYDPNIAFEEMRAQQRS